MATYYKFVGKRAKSLMKNGKQTKLFPNALFSLEEGKTKDKVVIINDLGKKSSFVFSKEDTQGLIQRSSKVRGIPKQFKELDTSQDSTMPETDRSNRTKAIKEGVVPDLAQAKRFTAMATSVLKPYMSVDHYVKGVRVTQKGNNYPANYVRIDLHGDYISEVHGSETKPYQVFPMLSLVVNPKTGQNRLFASLFGLSLPDKKGEQLFISQTPLVEVLTDVQPILTKDFMLGYELPDILNKFKVSAMKSVSVKGSLEVDSEVVTTSDLKRNLTRDIKNINKILNRLADSYAKNKAKIVGE